MDDALLKGLDHPIKLQVFEGPLDLLLFLIRKHEIDIYDIPVEQVTKQYIAVIYEMENLNLELAGDFFVMAATLMEIKSRMLLPKSEQLVQSSSSQLSCPLSSSASDKLHSNEISALGLSNMKRLYNIRMNELSSCSSFI